METLFECRNLTRSFREGRQSVEALRGASFALRRGECLGVVGESGSGKSTLLRVISGLEPSDAGEMFLEGRPLRARGKAELRAMQMIFQDARGSFNPRRRIRASIAETMRNLRGECTDAQIDALIGRVGLDPALSRRYPGELSGGQCQRLAIARAISVSPKLLLCDEITSALDVSAQAQILELLAALSREMEMAVIFVSHDLALVSCLCARALVMRAGEIVESGEMSELLRAPKQAYTRELLDAQAFVL